MTIFISLATTAFAVTHQNVANYYHKNTR